ncbi:LysR family transcriptional regulator [Nocardia aobensis]|uniref:LysR family transcriptional regulator n=1 Tax=Nocardia aobensis TaxID=257277 RepID=UPI003570DD23
MSLRQFEYALAVAEEGSVTAAAEQLHVAQPSMSQQIRSRPRNTFCDRQCRVSRGISRRVFSRRPGDRREAKTESERAVEGTPIPLRHPEKRWYAGRRPPTAPGAPDRTARPGRRRIRGACPAPVR